jgi:hypothetical protein
MHLSSDIILPGAYFDLNEAFYDKNSDQKILSYRPFKYRESTKIEAEINTTYIIAKTA